MRILLATDSEILRPRLRTILAGVPHSEIVQDVADERNIAMAARVTNPDVIVIAFPRLGRSTGRSIPVLRSVSPGAVIIMLTMAFNEVNEGAWLEWGATYVFDLTLQFDEFIDCVMGFSSADSDKDLHWSGRDSALDGTLNREIK